MLYFKFILTKNSLLSKICSRGNNHSTNQKGNSKSFFTRFEPPNSGAKIVFLISKIPIKSWLLPRPGFTLALAKVLGNEGKTTPSQKAKIVNWRCLLNEIRTYFEQNSTMTFNCRPTGDNPAQRFCTASASLPPSKTEKFSKHFFNRAPAKIFSEADGPRQFSIMIISYFLELSQIPFPMFYYRMATPLV